MREKWKAAMKQYYDESFDSFAEKIFTDVRSDIDDAVWILTPSGYVFKTNGVVWGMDLRINQGKNIPKADLELFDFVLTTHNHNDHFDKNFLNAISKTKTKIFIPDFIPVSPELFAENQENVIRIKAGDEIELFGHRIFAFESRHFRKDGNGTKELGYLVTVKGKTILFPVDIRNYDTTGLPIFDSVDCVFAHVWLGDKNGDKSPDFETISKFGEFYASFNPQRIYFAHLYETGRPISEMWRYEHAGLAMDAVLSLSPETDSCIMQPGRKYRLFCE